MATMPQRLETCIKTIESIYDQADVIRLYLNNFDKIPEEFKREKIVTIISEDLKSSGKLFWALNKNEYYFCIDDDIQYPETYSYDMINKLNEYNDNIIVSLHGKIMKPIINSYFRDISHNYHFLQNVEEDVFVDVIGNGVSVFNTNKIKIDYTKFKHHFMDDILVSLEALKQGKRRLVMKHEIGYCKYLNPVGFTLYGLYTNNDKQQTEIINTVKWR